MMNTIIVFDSKLFVMQTTMLEDQGLWRQIDLRDNCTEHSKFSQTINKKMLGHSMGTFFSFLSARV